VLKLVRKWLTAGVMEDGVLSQTVSGTPQGGVISPLLANIYLPGSTQPSRGQVTARSCAMPTMP